MAPSDPQSRKSDRRNQPDSETTKYFLNCCPVGILQGILTRGSKIGISPSGLTQALGTKREIPKSYHSSYSIPSKGHIPRTLSSTSFPKQLEPISIIQKLTETSENNILLTCHDYVDIYVTSRTCPRPR